MPDDLQYDSNLGVYVPYGRTRKTVTFDGTPGGGEAGTVVPVFTVTGGVLGLYIAAICKTTLTGATATISLGYAGDVDFFIAVTTATNLEAGEPWTAASPALDVIAVAAAQKDFLIGNGNDINVDPLTADVTGGVIDFTMLWVPLTSDGDVAAA